MRRNKEYFCLYILLLLVSSAKAQDFSEMESDIRGYLFSSKTNPGYR